MNNGVTNNTTNTTTQPVNSVQPLGQPQPQVQVQQAVPLAQQQPLVQPQVPQIEQSSIIETSANEPPKKKGKGSFIVFLVLIILLLILGIYYQILNHKKEIEQLNYECTPVSTTQEEKELDLKSTIVQDLYSKVATTIREDLAEDEFNDSMKLYLAYRQIVPNKFYDSNCNLYRHDSMEPYTCNVTTSFTPKAFKEEVLQQEVKKLFGERTEIPNANIQLGRACVGGYQYIADRGEYVQGYCKEHSATTLRVTKTLTKAISKNSTIILTEEVKYYGNEESPVPDYLKSGTYIYTFRLDTNYNYVLMSKEYQQKY